MTMTRVTSRMHPLTATIDRSTSSTSRTSATGSPHPRRSLLGMVAAAGLAATLAACGSSGTPTPAASSSSATSGSSSASSTSSAAGAAVKVASSSLGEIVVDAKGMTLYMYTKDTKGSGKSSCAGQCLAAWPPLLVDGTPVGDGVTGTLGTIDTPDGKKQVTLDGWPLYYYVKDTKAGDTTGQDVGKIWFVLDKSGTPIKAQATATNTGY